MLIFKIKIIIIVLYLYNVTCSLNYIYIYICIYRFNFLCCSHRTFTGDLYYVVQRMKLIRYISLILLEMVRKHEKSVSETLRKEALS